MKRSSRGISIAESVIAISVITVVSIAALSAILFSVNVQKKVIAQTEAQNFAQAVLESFKASDTLGDLKENVHFAYGLWPEEVREAGVYAEYKYTSAKQDFTAQVRVWLNWQNNGQNNGQNNRQKIEVYVSDKNGDKVLLLDYIKAG